MFEILAIERNIKERFSHFQKDFQGMEVLLKYNTILIDSGLKTDMFNIICSTGQENPQDVADSVHYFRKKQLPFCWWVGFQDDPAWLKEKLESEGLNHSEDEMVMAVHLNHVIWPEKRQDFCVEAVTSKDRLQDFLHVLSEIIPREEMKEIANFYYRVEPKITGGDPLMQYLVGYVNAKPVATCSVFYSEGIASIFDVIVGPTMRGKGLGKLITASGMRAAVENGSEIFALTATNDAKYLYEKLGYQNIKMMGVYS
jgi:ribosomal protein S18 acetylase RimI-like enzyme